MGKDKLAVLLHRQGFSCSISTVERIIIALKHAVSSTSRPGIIFQLIGREFNALRHEKAKGLLS
jgi:hypothetical protein